jgi:hypothetical protein
MEGITLANWVCPRDISHSLVISAERVLVKERLAVRTKPFCDICKLAAIPLAQNKKQ